MSSPPQTSERETASTLTTTPPKTKPVSSPQTPSKNDPAAKRALIAEIQHHWGQNFIRDYIPRCHRPLVKRSRGGRATARRAHETDPFNWLPSVLRAVLGLARLTADKEWVGRAMGEVVRWRVGRTGNRKPQLVTTDFHVLEDMLVRDWDVEFSFGVRYKHLLGARTRLEADEDIEHIFAVDEDSEEEMLDRGEHSDGDGDGDGDEGQNKLLKARKPRNGPHTPLPPTDKKKGNRNPDLPTRPQPPSHLDTQHAYTPYPYALDPWGRPIPPCPSTYPSGHESHNQGHSYAYAYPPYATYGGYAYPPQPPSQPPSQTTRHAPHTAVADFPPRSHSRSRSRSDDTDKTTDSVTNTPLRRYTAPPPFPFPWHTQPHHSPHARPDNPYPYPYPYPHPHPHTTHNSINPDPPSSPRPSTNTHTTPVRTIEPYAAHARSTTSPSRCGGDSDPDGETDSTSTSNGDADADLTSHASSGESGMSVAAREAEQRAVQLEGRVARLQARRAGLGRGRG